MNGDDRRGPGRRRRGRRGGRGGPRPEGAPQGWPQGPPREGARPPEARRSRTPPMPIERDDGPLPPLPPDPTEPRDELGEDLFVDLSPGPPPDGEPRNVCGVKFGDAGRIYDTDCGDVFVARGERVIIDGEHGVALATVASPTVRRLGAASPLRLVRRAHADDLRQLRAGETRGKEALTLFRRLARERRMPLHPVHCDMDRGGRRAMLYFASEQRVDFRELVRDLAQTLQMRIEMRQIGLRDAAKMIGGVGDCGQPLCCSTFLPRFEPISIRMAKDQGLPLNPSRVSGQCGRLKCCLIYEHSMYLDALRGLPRVGRPVATPRGDGRVQELDVLRRRVRVSFPDGGAETFAADAVQIRGGGPGGGPDGGGLDGGGPDGGGPDGGGAPPPDEPPPGIVEG